jgi:hypothetical protein
MKRFVFLTGIFNLTTGILFQFPSISIHIDAHRKVDQSDRRAFLSDRLDASITYLAFDEAAAVQIGRSFGLNAADFI